MSTAATIADRVRKLLALAADGNAGEADTAAAMAAKLMTEHSITLGDVAASTPRERPAVGVRRVDVSSAMWEAMLIHGVAQAMGGETVRSSRGGGVTMVVYAPEGVVDAILDLAQFLRLQVLREATREAHSANTASVRAWKRSYIVHAIARVLERLREQRRATVAASGSACTGLVVLSDAVKARMRADFPRLTQGRAVSTRDRGGALAGRAAGDRIDLGGGKLGGGTR